MKRIYLLIYSSFCILHSSFAQSGTWTWISGSDVLNSGGVYGTQGVPSVNNYPPGDYEYIEWKDKQGNFWIYGGTNSYSDLWKFNPVTIEWTWVKGDGLMQKSPVHGTQGVPNPSNTPGHRTWGAVTWVDTSGALWLFGGDGSPNDLWKYDIGTNEWTWVTGDTVANYIGVYGTQGIPSPLNTPGARWETSSAWTDSLNNLWLFGGFYYSGTGLIGDLNDLWKYNISANEWTWMKGADSAYAPANYGIKGVADINNDPGARWTYTKWKDVQGNFWLMGGAASLNKYSSGFELNDVWKYDLSINEWTWMRGSNFGNDTGNFQSNCVFDTINSPQSRFEQRSSVTDNCGRFWLFGGVVGNYSNNDLNDLWVFDPQQLKWNWISGTNVPNQIGNYGTLGVASPSNMPPSRCGAVAWWGINNKFYLFGGSWFDGQYSDDLSDLWVFNPDTNCVPPSSCNSVVVISPFANFQSSKTTLCANDCINFTDLSTNATSWQWSFAGASDSISTVQNPQNVCYPAAGTYNVTLVASNVGGSDWVTYNNYITVHPSPPAPNIDQVGNVIYCTTNPSYTSYQWYFKDTLIAGATDTFYVATQSGNYNVEVKDENGCKGAAGITVGLKDFSASGLEFSIYPNPANENLHLSVISKHQLGAMQIDVTNMLGETVAVFKEENAMGVFNKQINIADLSGGVYFVKVQHKEGVVVRKFVKE